MLSVWHRNCVLVAKFQEGKKVVVKGKAIHADGEGMKVGKERRGRKSDTQDGKLTELN